jgi:hypothetical protein
VKVKQSFNKQKRSQSASLNFGNESEKDALEWKMRAEEKITDVRMNKPVPAEIFTIDPGRAEMIYDGETRTTRKVSR